MANTEAGLCLLHFEPQGPWALRKILWGSTHRQGIAGTPVGSSAVPEAPWLIFSQSCPQHRSRVN